MSDVAKTKNVKKEMSRLANFTKGFFKENPVFVFLLGLCPALAVTGTVEASLGMGILVIFVLTSSNVVVSLIRKWIPHQIRVPSYIVIISTFVTIVGLLTEAYAYALHGELGIFIPLIVVNCLILGRAESYASKNKVHDAAIDGFGMGLGFLGALVVIGFFREFLSTGAIAYGVYLPLAETPGSIINIDSYVFSMDAFGQAPGGFLVIGLLLGIFNFVAILKRNKKERERQRMIEEKKRQALERKRQKAKEKAGANA